MEVRKAQVEIILVGMVLSLLLIGVVFLKLPFFILSLSILVLSLIIITIINTDLALIILIFSMLLSPEIKLIEVPARAVVVRIDDILLIVVFFSWLAKTAINKGLGLFRKSPLNPLIGLYIGVCIISTGIGIWRAEVSPLKSFFYLLKYIEYFMLYFMVFNNIHSKKQIKIFIFCFFITCMITNSYALLTVSKMERATAPFEGVKGEPNTLGGYLIVLFALSMSLFLYSSSKSWKIFSGLLLPFIFVTMLLTYSRSTYLAFVFMYLTLILFARKGKILIIGSLILLIVILPLILPKIITGVARRIEYTFSRGIEYKAFGKRIAIEASAASRIESWKKIFNKLKVRPFLGYGVTGVGLVDTQYPRILGETGIVGFLIFIWLLMRIFRQGIYAFNYVKDSWEKGLVLGFLAGFVGLIIHSLGANTFIIVRIMEPFWFLNAVVTSLPDLNKVS
ncbi:MAG: hypothetical protein DRP81_08715 [Candidatus Omnitrophota bacterium]|nr:MAG: hypothetical protein DRP81_08715 [Candidatus Omnitrophota bacterium]